MNWDQIKRNWAAVSDKIKLTWGKLSEDDLTSIAGERDQFADLLQERYGYDKTVAVNAVDQFRECRRPVCGAAESIVRVTSLYSRMRASQSKVVRSKETR